MSARSIVDGILITPSFMKIHALRATAFLRRISAPIRTKFSSPKSQKRVILFIVCLALLLDNMLFMVIVPIIDDFFDNQSASTTELMKTAEQTTVSNEYITQNQNVWNSTMLVQNGTIQTTQSTIKSKDFLGKIEKGFKNLHPVKVQDNKDGMMGLLFASKAIVQLSVNPFTGAFIDRIGYITPLTMGLMVMFLSTTVFACAQSYTWLFIARSLQGAGSALADTASFGLIADRFQNEGERSKALGIALAFISFGSLVAPPFGGVLYEFVGKSTPFILLALTCLFDASLLLLVEAPTVDEEREVEGSKPKGTPIYKLLMDPYIMIIAGALTIANFPLAFLEPTIAEWMQEKMNAVPWQVGLIWLPPFLPHVFGVYLTVKLSVKYFRYQWFYGIIGLITIGISTPIVPTCRSYGALIVPLSIMCFGIALIDTALLPTLAYLVDKRHTSVYGSVYAIADISYSVAYALGPILAGQAVQVMGYTTMNILIGMASILFAPTLYLLRRVYDWNVDGNERDNLLPAGSGYARFENRNGQTGSKNSLTTIGNDSFGYEDTNFTSDTAFGNGQLKISPVTEKSNNFLPENDNLSRDHYSPKNKSDVTKTTVNPRPRPRPRTISRDANSELKTTNTTSFPNKEIFESNRLDNSSSEDDLYWDGE